MLFEIHENKNTWRGCLFCITGQEKLVASNVEKRWPGARACAVSALKRRSRKGTKCLEAEVIMPSYVFFEVYEGFLPVHPLPDGTVRVLTTVNGDYKLVGNDDAFAKWILDHEGLIDISQACWVGERIVIQKGPLKDLEGYILKIDRRNQNGLVHLNVGDSQIRVWLPFEILETEEIKQIGAEVIHE